MLYLFWFKFRSDKTFYDKEEISINIFMVGWGTCFWILVKNPNTSTNASVSIPTKTNDIKSRLIHMFENEFVLLPLRYSDWPSYKLLLKVVLHLYSWWYKSCMSLIEIWILPEVLTAKMGSRSINITCNLNNMNSRQWNTSKVLSHMVQEE